MNPSTTPVASGQPLPPRLWVAVLLMADRTFRQSVPLPSPYTAEQVARASLLDADVVAAEVLALLPGSRRLAPAGSMVPGAHPPVRAPHAGVAPPI